NVQFRMVNHTNGNRYQWNPTTDLSCSDCPNPVASPKSSVSYTVKVTGMNGCDTTLNARIGVGTRPRFAVDTRARTVCEGVVVRVRATGEVSNLQWLPDDGSIDCPTCPEISIAPKKTTTYYVRSIDTASKCASLDSVRITVNPLPTFDTLGPTRTFCKGVLVQLIAGTGNTYRWTAAPNTQLSRTDIPNPTVTFPDTGVYRFGIRITNADSCFRDSTLAIRIIPCGDSVALTTTLIPSVIACDSVRSAISLRASGQVDIRIDSITVIRTTNATADITYLQQQRALLLPVTLKVGDVGLDFPIRIIPNAAGSYSITYRIYSGNTSRVDTVTLSGNSYKRDLIFRTTPQTQMSVDSTFAYVVVGESRHWGELRLNAVDASINYNNTVINYLSDRAPEPGDMLDSTWTVVFDQAKSTSSTVYFTLRGITPISKDGTLFTPYFRTLLGNETSIKPQFHYTLPRLRIDCADTNRSDGEVSVVLCAANIRRINISTTLFALNRVAPNPTNGGKLSIEYAIGYPCQADIRIYDVSGKEVTTLVHGHHGEGTYLLETDSSLLP
ncbi:MAG: hypothetical protein JNL32_15755, partial [Candidatus Kapabacteria bacterium]|nr:hypothetical protein [Candidatus Kapabacteria bacterium]